jgi:monoamine oxidase
MITRRAILNKLGMAGGLGATVGAMNALGLMGQASAQDMSGLTPMLGKG